jgi:hypothetical protein
MNRELSEDEVTLVVRALEHYSAYLVAAQREDRRYAERAGACGEKEAGLNRSDLSEVQSPDEGTEGPHLSQEAKVEVPQVQPR